MKTTVRLTESAVMLAAVFVLSLIPVAQMPFGGDVTLASMLPILVIAYRHGTGWGLLVGFAGSLLQLLMGLDNLSYATSAWAVVAIILLDYVFAFTALGLGGLFRNVTRSQSTNLVLGILLCCVLRYVCHLISGVTVWRGVDVPFADAFVYSLAYNSAYMIPETIITVASGVALSLSLDLRQEHLRRAPSTKGQPLKLISLLIAVVSTAVGGLWLMQGVQTEDGYAVSTLTPTDITVIAVCGAIAVISALVGILAKPKRTA